LVCKDAKAANLLEVVESFKDKYIETSRNVSIAVLISALNILNEAEINYKAARNKRLHVELVLIKLCYLQQAIELSSEGTGVSKKKLIESAKPVAFRHIAPLEVKSQKPQVKSQKSEERLIIQTPGIEKNKVAEENPAYGKPATNSQQPVTRNEQRETNNEKRETKISALDKIRKQYQGNGNAASNQANQPLQMEALQLAWAGYIQKLKAARNPAAQPFELARLQINDESSFEVITSNNIEQKFIEAERNELFSFLQQELKNRLLQFNVTVNENPEERPVVDAPLSSKDQFLKIAEQYPLVKELKDRLKLDLDY
jgi:DNA polymerase-3 subunit gamma/tau